MNRAMLGRMVLRAANHWPPGTALMAEAGDLTSASAAVLGGADLVDLGTAPPALISEFRARHPGILVCAAGPPADVMRDATVALPADALLICGAARAAQESDLSAERLLVDVLPAMVPEVSQAGLAALVDVDRAAELAAASDAHTDGTHTDRTDADGTDRGAGSSALAGVVAMAALSSWLGASVVRTRHVVPVRRALDMTATIRGIRPPTLTVRGLA